MKELNAKIKKSSQKGIEVNIKRFYIPFEVTTTCPKCGHVNTVDLNNEYLSYPILGEPDKVYFSCYNEDKEDYCEEEYEVEVILNLSLKLA